MTNIVCQNTIDFTELLVKLRLFLLQVLLITYNPLPPDFPFGRYSDSTKSKSSNNDMTGVANKTLAQPMSKLNVVLENIFKKVGEVDRSDHCISS